MCEVCAIFGLSRHWADAAARADPRLPAPDIVRYRAERKRRIALVNALLAGTGVEVTDWNGEAFWVSERSGRGEVTSDLSAVWRAAERLAGREIDPLAATFAIES